MLIITLSHLREGMLYLYKEGFVMKKVLFDFEVEFEELMDRAFDVLLPDYFEMLLDYVQKCLADYEDRQEGE